MPTRKIKLASVLFIILIGGCASMAVPLPPGTLNAAEVTALFSGKTVESRLDETGRISLTYYNPDGRLHQLQEGRIRNGSWRVKDNGRICLQMEQKSERCRIIVNEGTVYRKYVVKADGSHQPIITYTSFRKGNLVDR